MSPHEQRRTEYLWAFAHLLHTPPALVDLLTVEEFEAGCLYIDRMNRQAAKEGGD